MHVVSTSPLELPHPREVLGKRTDEAIEGVPVPATAPWQPLPSYMPSAGSGLGLVEGVHQLAPVLVGPGGRNCRTVSPRSPAVAQGTSVGPDASGDQVENVARAGVDQVDVPIDTVIHSSGVEQIAHLSRPLWISAIPASATSVCRVTVFPRDTTSPPPT